MIDSTKQNNNAILSENIILALREVVGLQDDSIELLTKLLLSPPDGTVNAQELSQSSKTEIALYAAIILASMLRSHEDNLRKLLDHVATQEERLGTLDRGRFWHINGFAAWRFDNDIYHAYTALNRSIDLLNSTPKGNCYLARVWDTFGQLLHHLGAYQEAKLNFETALNYRKQCDDKTGAAITFGNLGRVCIDLGDYEEAYDYFKQDLSIVNERTPQYTQLITQIYSHIGTCAIEIGKLTIAEQHFQKSHQLATSDNNHIGIIFSEIGLGKISLEQKDDQCTKIAQQYLQAAKNNLSSIDHKTEIYLVLQGLILDFSAEIHTTCSNTDDAIADYEKARIHLSKSKNITPAEMVKILYRLTLQYLLKGYEHKASLLLREILIYLDGTSLDLLRNNIEEQLENQFPELWLLHSAGRFISQKQVSMLLTQSKKSGFQGKKTDAVVLFSDIRGFTSLSESLEPEQLIYVLNKYLSNMTKWIEHYGGIVDKFIGDAVMAFFLPDETNSEDANQRAVNTALMMTEDLKHFNRTLPDNIKGLKIGIGLHYGSLVAGLIGSPQKRSYTVIGDTVNTASRLEGMTKMLGANILISQEVHNHLPQDYLLRPLGSYCPKGRDKPIEVYALMGTNDNSFFSRAINVEIDKSIKGIEYLQSAEIDHARKIFCDLESKGGNQKSGYRFLINEIDKQSINLDYTGVIRLNEK